MIRKRKTKLTLDGVVSKANHSDIASIGTVVNNVLKAINSPDSSAKVLRDIIEVDPPLCAKILKRANSAHYGITRKINTIDEAIVLIGFSTAKELALSLKISSIFKKSGEGELSMQKLWKHSVAVALCAKHLYRREFKEYGDNAYSIGLLHDIGIIVEQQFLEDEFKALAEKLKEDETSLIKAEKQILSYSHCDIIGRLGEAWNFNKDMIMTAKYHHSPMAAPPDFKKGTCALFVADFACHASHLGFYEFKDESSEFETYEKCLEFLNIRPKALEVIMADVAMEVEELEKNGELYL